MPLSTTGRLAKGERVINFGWRSFRLENERASSHMCKILAKLFSSPVNVTYSILGTWLVLKSIVAMDSAFCNQLIRKHFIYLLSTKELIHRNPVTLQGAKMLQWLNSKLLKAANILFETETERSPFLVQYIESFGNSVRSVHFRDKCNEVDVMCLIACYCKNITILRCTNVTLSLPFHAILRNNPNIQEIWVRDATCLVDDLMVSLSLHKLTLFSVQNMFSCVKGFPWSENTYSNSLSCAEFICTTSLVRDMLALTQNCSNLRSFGCERITIEDESLISVLGRRLEIINLSVNNSHVVTDNAVCFIAQNLPCLRTLNIQNARN